MIDVVADEKDHSSDGLEGRILSALQARVDNLYRQLEALMWLRDMLQLERPLPPLRWQQSYPD